MRYLIITLLLVTPVLAIELYWDDGNLYGYQTGFYRHAVLFHDFDGDGPGDTHGELGIISEIKVALVDFSPPEFYIYSMGDGDYPMPDERLAGPLPYQYQDEDPWYIFVLDSSVEVPGDFFVMFQPQGDTKIHSDGSEEDWGGFYHSRWLGTPEHYWHYVIDDYLLRIEWESLEPVVVETSWGEIKASF